MSGQDLAAALALPGRLAALGMTTEDWEAQGYRELDPESAWAEAHAARWSAELFISFRNAAVAASASFAMISQGVIDSMKRLALALEPLLQNQRKADAAALRARQRAVHAEYHRRRKARQRRRRRR